MYHGPASPCSASRPDTQTPAYRLPLSLLLAAQRTGEKWMCSSVYLLMLPVWEKLTLLTGTYTPRGPVAHRIVSVSCEVSCLIMLSLMVPRVCTLVLSCSYVTFYIPLHSPAPPLYNCDEMYILCGFKVCRDSRCIHVRTRTDKSPTHVLTNICCE